MTTNPLPQKIHRTLFLSLHLFVSLPLSLLKWHLIASAIFSPRSVYSRDPSFPLPLSLTRAIALTLSLAPRVLPLWPKAASLLFRSSLV
jgi:hypothetical protein